VTKRHAHQHDHHRGKTPRFRGLAIQLLGLMVGLGLLAWCVNVAFRPENRQQLDRLGDASAMQVSCMLLLSVLSLLCNGIVFWGVIRPVRVQLRNEALQAQRPPLGFWHVQCVNAVATCLAYIPFKLSVVFRFFVHRVHDHVPIGTIASWMAAAAAALATVCGPVLIAGVVLGDRAKGMTLIGASLAGILVLAVTGWAVARYFAGHDGLVRIRRWIASTRIGILRQVADSKVFADIHAGFAMVGDPRGWATGLAGRVGDVAAQSVRFWLAGQILGVEIDPGVAVLLGVTYFALGAASPSGALGIREGGATGLAALLHLDQSQSYAAITLLVTAADSVPTLLAAGGGLAAVLRKNRARTQPQAE
jgi:hypothetical protein